MSVRGHRRGLERTAVGRIVADAGRRAGLGRDQRRPLRLVDVLPTDNTERDPESRLLVREQIDSVLHALPTLTPSERAAMSGGLSGQTNRQLAQALKVTPKAASQAAYRARRKLAAAPPRAA